MAMRQLSLKIDGFLYNEAASTGQRKIERDLDENIRKENDQSCYYQAN